MREPPLLKLGAVRHTYFFNKMFNWTNRLKTPIFHYRQVYLGYKSKQSIDMAGPCSILMDFDYTEAKLCKIRPFSSYFCSEKILVCSEKILFCSEKTLLCSSKTPLWPNILKQIRPGNYQTNPAK